MKKNSIDIRKCYIHPISKTYYNGALLFNDDKSNILCDYSDPASGCHIAKYPSTATVVRLPLRGRRWMTVWLLSPPAISCELRQATQMNDHPCYAWACQVHHSGRHSYKAAQEWAQVGDPLQ